MARGAKSSECGVPCNIGNRYHIIMCGVVCGVGGVGRSGHCREHNFSISRVIFVCRLHPPSFGFQPDRTAERQSSEARLQRQLHQVATGSRRKRKSRGRSRATENEHAINNEIFDSLLGTKRRLYLTWQFIADL